MTTRDNVHPITEADLAAHRDGAEFRMQNVPMRGVAYDIVSEIRKLPGVGGYLLNEHVNHVLHTMLQGTCLFYELYEELGRQPGASAALRGSYGLFGMAALVAQQLPEPHGDNLATFPRPEAGFFRTGVGPDDDLKAVLSFYLKIVTQTGTDGQPIVESADDLISITRDYFAAARDAMIDQSDTLPADAQAQVVGQTFRVLDVLELQGFSVAGAQQRQKATFTPVLPEQIVGNTSAKRALTRYIDRIALYDAERGFNPVLEFGGLPSTVLFDGFPGTGKTSLFRMAMTRMNQRSEQVGLPAQFVTIDPSIKDEYYGKTAKLLTEKLALARDPKSLTLLFFDDIDLLLLSRGDPGMGGSDKDVLNLTMQFLDGAFTTHVGNAQTYAATNEPTATDSALRQRFHQREAIDGPEDWDDYAALLGIKLARQIRSGLVQVGGELPTALAAQASGKPGQHFKNAVQSLLPKGGKGMNWRELGELCAEFKRKDPRFTGRPIESVTQKLLAESADFDVPEEWFTNPDLYLAKPYDERVAMLKGLYRPITGDMIAAELEQYMASEQRYAAEAKNQKAQRAAADLEAQLAARQLISEQNG